MWTRKTTTKITMLERKAITEEGNIIKKIRKNNTREKEVIQALEKNDGLTWKEDGVLWQPLITKTNDYTNGKSLSWISSGEFTRELNKESLLN